MKMMMTGLMMLIMTDDDTQIADIGFCIVDALVSGKYEISASKSFWHFQQFLARL
jgi:hypothetical protein